ncbi:uncharacterized protein [Rutidosis leptorrhynchoides]|uniref:uncharacterized protein n=1 Tax=Rutidosis leptorrhynchoides TaxID=125765 RepID=UPI003A9A48D4
MKLWERSIETRHRREIKVPENKFGFMPGCSSMEAIHIIRSLMEKYREKQKNLHIAFLDLEKSYDSVPHELIWKTLNGRDELSQGIQESIPWCLIFADDIVLFSESQDELNGRLEQWRNAFEQNGLRISRNKSEYLRCDFGRVEEDQNVTMDVRTGDQVLLPHDCFRYLGSMLHKSGRIDDDVTHHIKVGWLK